MHTIAHYLVTKNIADLLRATLSNVGFLVVLTGFVSGGTLAMLSPLLAFADVITCYLLFHLLGLLEITKQKHP